MAQTTSRSCRGPSLARRAGALGDLVAAHLLVEQVAQRGFPDVDDVGLGLEGREDAGQRADGAVGCGDDEELAVRRSTSPPTCMTSSVKSSPSVLGITSLNCQRVAALSSSAGTLGVSTFEHLVGLRCPAGRSPRQAAGALPASWPQRSTRGRWLLVGAASVST